ncbi:hypothetical protein ABW19_dt0210517 [Dactylella cylindrospora]|nr:hypothetical protein ABW19_dt0210517 [Dactylella cylindrospora]
MPITTETTLYSPVETVSTWTVTTTIELEADVVMITETETEIQTLHTTRILLDPKELLPMLEPKSGDDGVALRGSTTNITITTATSEPSSSESPPSESSPPRTSGTVSSGVIIGSVVGAASFISIAVAAGLWFLLNKRRKRQMVFAEGKEENTSIRRYRGKKRGLKRDSSKASMISMGDSLHGESADAEWVRKE